MTYPPSWRLENESGAALEIARAHPFAHLFTAHRGLASTRVPFVVDVENGKPTRLRAHLNGQNPQADGLDGAEVLVVFSGPSTYVSPHWRASKTRAGTFDYQEVRVRGTARLAADIGFFRRLIDDLSSLIEPQYSEIGDYPVWQTPMAPEGYIERLFPSIVPFAVEIASVETVSKLHQHFPEDDRRSIADHLARGHRDGSRAIAALIRRSLPG